MTPPAAITEAEIFAGLAGADEGSISREAAEALLKLAFRQPAIDRMNELAERNRQGILTSAEQAELEKYLRVGMFLNLVQAKARLSLKEHSQEAR
jgi:uncharacterized protein YnzC (UPF0291/DUF896 family)